MLLVRVEIAIVSSHRQPSFLCLTRNQVRGDKTFTAYSLTFYETWGHCWIQTLCPMF